MSSDKGRSEFGKKNEVRKNKKDEVGKDQVGYIPIPGRKTGQGFYSGPGSGHCPANRRATTLLQPLCSKGHAHSLIIKECNGITDVSALGHLHSL